MIRPSCKYFFWRYCYQPALSLTLTPYTNRGRFSPDGRDMTPLTQSAGISIPDTRSFVFPKNMGLGVLVSGGIGRERGPYIVIEKILEGMDAAKVCKSHHIFLTLMWFCNLTRLHCWWHARLIFCIDKSE